MSSLFCLKPSNPPLWLYHNSLHSSGLPVGHRMREEGGLCQDVKTIKQLSRNGWVCANNPGVPKTSSKNWNIMYVAGSVQQMFQLEKSIPSKAHRIFTHDSTLEVNVKSLFDESTSSSVIVCWGKYGKILSLILASVVLKYRVIQEESALLWEMIVWVILSKKVHTNMGPIWTVTELWAFFNSRTRPNVNRAYGTSWRLVAYCMHSKH